MTTTYDPSNPLQHDATDEQIHWRSFRITPNDSRARDYGDIPATAREFAAVTNAATVAEYEAKLEASHKAYYRLADAITASSTSPDDLAEQARTTRHERDALLENVATLKPDAERYRYLRNNARGFKAVDGNATFQPGFHKHLDETVDRAIVASPLDDARATATGDSVVARVTALQAEAAAPTSLPTARPALSTLE